MRAVLALLLALAPLAGAAQGPSVAPADAAAVRKVIEAQLDAFRKDDAERAFSYATEGIRLTFLTAQNFMEMVLEQFVKEMDETVGHAGRAYLPLIMTLGLFILTSNLMGLVPGLIAPTANLNTTAACALIVFVTYHVIGVRKQGFIPYMKHFAGPVPTMLKPLMFVIEIISHCARPLSLSLRLFGNMLGGHVAMKVFAGFVVSLGGLAAGGGLGYLGIPGAALSLSGVVALTALEFLVAFLQAFVFAVLACVYLNDAVHADAH